MPKTKKWLKIWLLGPSRSNFAHFIPLNKEHVTHIWHLNMILAITGFENNLQCCSVALVIIVDLLLFGPYLEQWKRAIFGAMKTSEKKWKKLIEYQKLSTIPPVLLNVIEVFYTNVVNEKLQMDISDHNMLCCFAF